MAKGKRKAKAGNPAKKPSSKEPTSTPPQEAGSSKAPTPKTPSQLPLAGPATPTKAVLEQKVVTPELQYAMEPEDVAEVAAVAETMPPPSRTEEAKALLEKQAALVDAAFRRVKEEEEALEARLDQVTEQIAILSHKWEEGKIALPRGRYLAQRAKNLNLQQQLMSRLSLLLTKGAQLAGSWASDMITDGIKRDMVEDWTLIDAVLRCYPELKDARKTIKPHRTQQQQVLFRKKLFSTYGGGPNNETEFIYCPISHARVELATAAHLVDVNVGVKTAAALFGEDEEHIWSAKNGLLMHKAFEELLDNAKAVILPASDEPDEAELVFFLLTTDIGPQRAAVWGHEALHGRKLVFINDYRPGKRYLYFKAIMTLLRRRRAEVDGHWNDLEQLPSIAKMMWASPGPYLRNSILYRFSREVGCLTKKDANRFWGLDTEEAFAGLSLEDNKTVGALAAQASSAALATKSGKDSQGEETESEGRDDMGEYDDDPFIGE